jgi:hypothetical protein
VALRRRNGSRAAWTRRFCSEHLAQAEGHVAQGRKHIASQQDIVASLERKGLDARQARMLATCEEIQATHVADRDRLRREVAEQEQSGRAVAPDAC